MNKSNATPDRSAALALTILIVGGVVGGASAATCARCMNENATNRDVREGRLCLFRKLRIALLPGWGD